MVFGQDYYGILIIAHLLLTVVLVGSSTHDLICVVGFVRGKFGRKKLERLYVKVGFWSYVLVYVTGALAYPAFRVFIRADYFDQQLPWATGLFEVKEHWGAIGLALFAVYYALRKSFEPDQERDKLFFYASLCLIINLIIWYKVGVGCWLSLLKGSW